MIQDWIIEAKDKGDLLKNKYRIDLNGDLNE